MGPTTLSQPLSPTLYLRQGLDWTGRTGPGRFAGLLAIRIGLLSLWRLGPAWIEGWGRGAEAMALIPVVVFTVPAVVHVLRRLNDMGWRGWWAWVLALPGLRWALLVLLVVVPSSHRQAQGDGPWRILGVALAGVVSVCLAASLLWTMVLVVAQDMKPALRPGDLVLVRRAPATPETGDVIAFRLPGEDHPRIARVIAAGGQSVAVRGGVPVIDGVPATWAEAGLLVETFERQGPHGLMPVCGNGAVGLGAECRTRQFRETLPNAEAHLVLDAGSRPLDRVGEVAVPNGFLYVMGDNRDAARDSRLARAAQGTGLVAVEQVIGRVDMVLASSMATRFWALGGWRPWRIGESVE